MLDDEQASRADLFAAAGARPRKESADKDRRRYGRRGIRGGAGAWTANASVDAEGIGRQPVVVRNVSLEGARFEAAIALDPAVEFVLRVQVGGRELQIPCEVVNVWKSGCSVGERFFIHGCRFLFISPRDAQAVAAMERIE